MSCLLSHQGVISSPIQVLGWYHSHPHITVWPSHVDVGTQADYQLMDSNFIGLIFSCFNDGDKVTVVFMWLIVLRITNTNAMFLYVCSKSVVH